MNGKKAKKLRRMSEKATVGLPYRRFKPGRRQRILVTCTRLVCNTLKEKYKSGLSMEDIQKWLVVTNEKVRKLKGLVDAEPPITGFGLTQAKGGG